MKRITFLIVALILANTVSAQKVSFRHGARLYKQLAYHEAIPYLEESYRVDTTNTDALRMLADSYRQVNDVDNMLKYYSKLVHVKDAKAIEKYYYGHALMKSGNYVDARIWLAEYRDDERGPIQASALENIDVFFKDSSNYSIQNLKAINSPSSEMGVSIFENELLFSSNRYKADAIDNKHEWTGKDFYKLFTKNISNNLDVVKFTNDVQAKYNVGPVAYVESEKTLYITRNQMINGKSIKGFDDEIKLQIYSYLFNEQTKSWTNESACVFNNKNYNVAHPALNASGDILVISSDIPGGYGGMDLWVSHRKEGEWSPLVNLGSEINTKGNELFPSISANNILFYSSDGKEGLGGLDIYCCNFSFGVVKNHTFLSYPINSQGDDFGLIMSKDLKTAYFASNRPGGFGDDDVYQVTIKKPFNFSLMVRGNAFDKETHLPLEGVIVALVNEDKTKIAQITTKENGYYEFEIDPQVEYMLIGNKPKYVGDEKSFTGEIPKGEEFLIVNLELEEIKSFNLYCVVTDKSTNEPLTDVIIRISDAKSTKLLYQLKTNDIGSVRQFLENARLNDELHYFIELEKEGYLTKNLSFEAILEKPGEIALHETLDLKMEKIEIGSDLGKILAINPIYFDLAKWNIRPDAAAELDKIVKVMQENPGMVIELGSHTDCRASAAFNMDLSDKRAKSSAAYIVSKGIDKSRISGKGYGETKLVNQCECEGDKVVPCTEEEHQMNRRTEFIIVKM